MDTHNISFILAYMRSARTETNFASGHKWRVDEICGAVSDCQLNRNNQMHTLARTVYYIMWTALLKCSHAKRCTVQTNASGFSLSLQPETERMR